MQSYKSVCNSSKPAMQTYACNCNTSSTIPVRHNLPPVRKQLNAAYASAIISGRCKHACVHEHVATPSCTADQQPHSTAVQLPPTVPNVDQHITLLQGGNGIQYANSVSPDQQLSKVCQNQTPGSRKSSRRAVLASTAAASAAGLLQGLALPGAAIATKTITLRDGTTADVFEHGMSLNIVSLKGSVPGDWIMNYRQTLGKYSGFTLGQRDQMQTIYKELSDPPGTKNSAAAADVISLGDAWLGPAVKAGLLQPIPNAENSRWWRSLPPRWHALLRRDASGLPNPKGDIYASPYRWGATLVAYRKQLLISRGGRPITDWSDLLQPQLRGKIAMTESARDFLGIALKASQKPQGANKLGFNTSASGLASQGLGLEECVAAGRALREQVKLFSSRDHVRAFIAGDVLAVVGWSQDMITLAERSNSVEVVLPSSGTALFADMWAVPAGAMGGHMQQGPSPLLPSWLEFSIAPARIANFPGLKSGASPLLLEYQPEREVKKEGIAGNVLNYDNGYLPADYTCIHNSEFLLPLDAKTQQLYKDVLQGLRPT